jgi:hypothetical protein
MDNLFEGISSGAVGGASGAYVRTPSGLHAGFLVEEGSCGESRSYALFEIDQKDGRAIFNRLCNKSEKKLLGKAHYHYKALKNVEVETSTQDVCILFTHR